MRCVHTLPEVPRGESTNCALCIIYITSRTRPPTKPWGRRSCLQSSVRIMSFWNTSEESCLEDTRYGSSPARYHPMVWRHAVGDHSTQRSWMKTRSRELGWSVSVPQDSERDRSALWTSLGRPETVRPPTVLIQPDGAREAKHESTLWSLASSRVEALNTKVNLILTLS